MKNPLPFNPIILLTENHNNLDASYTTRQRAQSQQKARRLCTIWQLRKSFVIYRMKIIGKYEENQLILLTLNSRLFFVFLRWSCWCWCNAVVRICFFFMFFTKHYFITIIIIIILIIELEFILILYHMLFDNNNIIIGIFFHLHSSIHLPMNHSRPGVDGNQISHKDWNTFCKEGWRK